MADEDAIVAVDIEWDRTSNKQDVVVERVAVPFLHSVGVEKRVSCEEEIEYCMVVEKIIESCNRIEDFFDGSVIVV